VILRPAPVTPGRLCSAGLVVGAVLQLHAGAGWAQAVPAAAGPLVPPQALMAPDPAAAGRLGPTLLLPQPGPVQLPLVSGPLQWPGETPASPGAAANLGALPGSGTPPPAAEVSAKPSRQLVLDRQRRLLLVLDNGQERHRYAVAVGMPGWETPVGRFEVIEKTANPVWEHPATGAKFKPGPDNPLGSRWIGFHRDCRGRKGFNGQEHLELKGCVIAGFHGTPNRASVGRAVSHGCVRLYDENVQELFDLVQIGTPVTVLP
jgi:L,D-transpeptidase ErfK/SrfK